MISWKSFRIEAEAIAKREFMLSSVIESTILCQNSFASAIACQLATSFSGIIPYSAWNELLNDVFNGKFGDYSCGDVCELMLDDLNAIQQRDPACHSIVSAFLHFKGFKALQSHRAAHILWHAKPPRRDIALAIQSRCSELWALDIHPACSIGGGLLIDHGTGVVIGETAVVGRNCSFLHGVTLGSTGKDAGDRHPKIGDDVLIGCNAIVLGNISIGRSAKIGSGSVVIKSVPAGVTAVGNPARIVGRSSEASTAANEMDLALRSVIAPSGCSFRTSFYGPSPFPSTNNLASLVKSLSMDRLSQYITNDRLQQHEDDFSRLSPLDNSMDGLINFAADSMSSSLPSSSMSSVSTVVPGFNGQCHGLGSGGRCSIHQQFNCCTIVTT